MGLKDRNREFKVSLGASLRTITGVSDRDSRSRDDGHDSDRPK